MLPLHEDTVFLLAALAVGGCAATFAAWRGRLRRWVYAALSLATLAWPWPIAFYLGLNHFTITAAFYLNVWTAGAGAAGTIWGLVLRQVLARTVLIAVAVLPFVAGAAYLLEHQRVPNAPCAARALFWIGGLTIAVPSEMGARSVETSGAAVQVWQGRYSDWPGDKPKVRALCRATGNGQEVVRVHHLWFPVSWFRKLHQAECTAGSVPDDLRAYCAAIARTRLTVVQLYARLDGLPDPSLGYFNPEPVVRSLSAGSRTGYECGPPSEGPKTRYCTIWQQFTPDVLAVSSAQLGPVAEGEDPVADSAIILETLITSLRPEESN